MPHRKTPGLRSSLPRRRFPSEILEDLLTSAERPRDPEALGNAAHVDGRALDRYLAALEDRKFLARKPSGALRLTPQGKRFLQDVRRVTRHFRDDKDK